MKLGRTIRLFLALALGTLAGCVSLHERSLARSEYDRAVRAQKLGHTQQAIDALQMSARANPGFTPAHALLGDLYKEQGRFDLASDQYKLCTAQDPRSAGHFYDLALMDQLLGRLQEAAASYVRSLKLKPANADANMNLGTVYIALGDHQHAIERLKLAATQKPDSIDVWTNLGVAYDDAGEFSEGEKAYRKGLELRGDKVALLINYGGNLIQQRLPDEAIKLFQQAIDLKDTPLAEKRMGDALAAKGWQDAAVGRYERATRLDARYVSAYNALGDALIALYDRGLQLNESFHQRAVTAWQMSLAIQPEQPAVTAKLAKWVRSDS